MYRTIIFILIVIVLTTACGLLPNQVSQPVNQDLPSLMPVVISEPPITNSPHPLIPSDPEPVLAPIEPELSPVAQPEPKLETGVVNVDGLNLRLGPGTDHLVVRLMNRGLLLDILGRNERNDWLLVELTSGTQGWVYYSYVDTSANIAELPLREAYGGAYVVEPVIIQDDPKPLDINVVIENNIATVQISGFPGGQALIASLGPSRRKTDLVVASGTSSPNGNATLQFNMPAEWADGSPVKSGTLSLVVSTSDGSFDITASIQYYR
jgi:uncharacterized protein YgiM (DUF1202 family)